MSDKEIMNINIYGKYVVKVITEASRLIEECVTKYDNIFVQDRNVSIIEMDGATLLGKIAHNLKENYLSEFVIVGKNLHFDYFNYNTGESEHICFEIIEKGDKNE